MSYDSGSTATEPTRSPSKRAKLPPKRPMVRVLCARRKGGSIAVSKGMSVAPERLIQELFEDATNTN